VKSKEHQGGEPYDLRADPDGYYHLIGRSWRGDPECIHLNNFLRFGPAKRSLCALIDQFKNYVENNEGCAC